MDLKRLREMIESKAYNATLESGEKVVIVDLKDIYKSMSDWVVKKSNDIQHKCVGCMGNGKNLLSTPGIGEVRWEKCRKSDRC